MVNLKKIIPVLFLSILISSDLFAQTFVIDSEKSSIVASASYVALGRYTAKFEEFDGQLIYDEKDVTKSSVNVFVDNSSLKSKHSSIDNLIKSKGVLNIEKNPTTSFVSLRLESRSDGYYAVGDLYLHGIKKEISFPYKLSEVRNEMGSIIAMKGEGVSKINRKDFDVIWNKYLDRGGIIVGNEIKIDWKIYAVRMGF